MSGTWHKILTSVPHRRIFFLALRRLNLIKTLWFNFRVLPLRQALRIPIWIYGRISFVSLRGRVEIRAKHISPAMIHLGFPEDMYFNPKEGGVINNDGKIIFNGPIFIACGYNLRTYDQGSISFGEGIKLGAKLNLVSHSSGIRIGDHSRIAFESVIMDSGFHFIKSLNDPLVHNVDAEVVIGNYNWISNRTVVNKGTRTPDNLIVASGSLLNKDYTKDIPEYSLIGGTPAKFIKGNISRIWNGQTEVKLREYFTQSGAQALEVDDSTPLK